MKRPNVVHSRWTRRVNVLNCNGCNVPSQSVSQNDISKFEANIKCLKCKTQGVRSSLLHRDQLGVFHTLLYRGLIPNYTIQFYTFRNIHILVKLETTTLCIFWPHSHKFICKWVYSSSWCYDVYIEMAHLCRTLAIVLHQVTRFICIGMDKVS